MRRICFWEADDGKRFEDEIDCMVYETIMLNYPIIKEIKAWDAEGERIYFPGDEDYTEWGAFHSHFYQDAYEIEFKTKEQVDAFNDVAEELDWMDMQGVFTETGYYKWVPVDMFNKGFRKVAEAAK